LRRWDLTGEDDLAEQLLAFVETCNQAA